MSTIAERLQARQLADLEAKDKVMADNQAFADDFPGRFMRSGFFEGLALMKQASNIGLLETNLDGSTTGKYPLLPLLWWAKQALFKGFWAAVALGTLGFFAWVF